MNGFTSLPAARSPPSQQPFPGTHMSQSLSNPHPGGATDSAATTPSRRFPLASNARPGSGPSRFGQELKASKKTGPPTGLTSTAIEAMAAEEDLSMGPIESGAKEYRKFHWTEAEGKRLLLAYCKTVQEEVPDFPYDRLVENFKEGLHHGDLVTMPKIRKYLTKAALDVRQANLPVPTIDASAAKIPTNLPEPQTTAEPRRRTNQLKVLAPRESVQSMPEMTSSFQSGMGQTAAKRTRPGSPLPGNAKRTRRQPRRSKISNTQRSGQQTKSPAVVPPSDDDTEDEVIEEAEKPLHTPHDRILRGARSSRTVSQTEFNTSAGPPRNKRFGQAPTALDMAPPNIHPTHRASNFIREPFHGFSNPSFQEPSGYAMEFDNSQNGFGNTFQGQNVQGRSDLPIGGRFEDYGSNSMRHGQDARLCFDYSDPTAQSNFARNQTDQGGAFHEGGHRANPHTWNSPAADGCRRKDSAVDIQHTDPALLEGENQNKNCGRSYMITPPGFDSVSSYPQTISKTGIDTSGESETYGTSGNLIQGPLRGATPPDDFQNLEMLANDLGPQAPSLLAESLEHYAHPSMADFNLFSDQDFGNTDLPIDTAINQDMEEGANRAPDLNSRMLMEGDDRQRWPLISPDPDGDQYDGVIEDNRG